MARRAFARWFVLAGLLGLAGCWPQPGWGPEHQRWNPIEDQLTAANVADLEVDWEAATGLSSTEPIVQAGRVYVGEVVQDGGWVPQVTAFDVDSGDPAWRAALADPLPVPTIDVPGVAVAGPDLLATWSVYFRSQFWAVCDAQVVRLDPATGEVRSTTPGPQREAGAPVPFGDRYGIVRADSSSPVCPLDAAKVEVHNAATGQSTWVGRHGSPAAGPMGGPTVIGDQLLVSAGTDLESFPAGGCGTPERQPAWVLDLPTEITEPVAAGGTVFVADADGLVAVDRATGTVAWRGDLGTGSDAAIAYAAGVVYAVGDDVVRAFDAGGCGAPGAGVATCPPLWSAPLRPSPQAGQAHPIAVAGGVVYVASSFADGEASLLAFDAGGCSTSGTTCQPVWDTTVDGQVASLVVAQGRLFVSAAGPIGDDSRIVAYTLNGI